MKRNELLGAWEMLSFEGRSEKGSVFRPFGDRPTGKLIYTESGDMTVVMSKATRPPLKQLSKADLLERTDAILTSVLEDFNAYSGTFTFDEATQTVVHRYTAAYFHEWVGTTQERYAELREPDVLVLKTEKMVLEFKGEKDWWFEVAWRRRTAV